jgi:hypothetical protein
MLYLKCNIEPSKIGVEKGEHQENERRLVPAWNTVLGWNGIPGRTQKGPDYRNSCFKLLRPQFTIMAAY